MGSRSTPGVDRSPFWGRDWHPKVDRDPFCGVQVDPRGRQGPILGSRCALVDPMWSKWISSGVDRDPIQVRVCVFGKTNELIGAELSMFLQFHANPNRQAMSKGSGAIVKKSHSQ